MYSEMLAHEMTIRLQRRILPRLAWNQELYGRQGIRWLDFGCGKRLLCGGLEKLESQMAILPFVGMDPCWQNLKEQQHAAWRVQADGHHLPFRDESFDLIAANMDGTSKSPRPGISGNGARSCARRNNIAAHSEPEELPGGGQPCSIQGTVHCGSHCSGSHQREANRGGDLSDLLSRKHTRKASHIG
jgi:SAM-dependent methyltransferase